jgi:predicted acylesterase/phospholipase RssA
MDTYSILGLNGGGMRGALQLGALCALSDKVGEPQLYKVFHDGVYGISVGAIISSLIAFGFTIEELNKFTDYFVNIQDSIHPPRLQSFLTFAHTRGLDDGALIYKQIDSIFKTRGQDLASLRVGDALIPLHIVASDITNLKIVRFGPGARLWDALRASMSLPFIFTPHVIRGSMFVDGAVLCQNIMSVIPKSDRAKSLLLLTTHTASVTPENYASVLPFCRSLMETHRIKELYPENTCLLVEDNTQMFSFWDNRNALQNLVNLGRGMFLDFWTKRGHQELAHDSD